MKAMLKLLDGQPTTVQDKPSRLLPQQKEEKEVQAEIPAGTGKAVEEEEEEEEEEVSIEREPLRPSPQSEFRQVI